jgi:hypothetical protein
VAVCQQALGRQAQVQRAVMRVVPQLALQPLERPEPAPGGSALAWDADQTYSAGCNATLVVVPAVTVRQQAAARQAEAQSAVVRSVPQLALQPSRGPEPARQHTALAQQAALHVPCRCGAVLGL